MTAAAHDTTSELARDLVFLAVAGDDELAALGFGYATVRVTAGDAPDPLPTGTLGLHPSGGSARRRIASIRRSSSAIRLRPSLTMACPHPDIVPHCA